MADTGSEAEELESTSEREETRSPTPPRELLASYHFGCGPFHPRSLQFLASRRAFTVFLCLFAIIEGAVVIGLTSVNLSSISKRYHLTSTAAGVIPTTFDITVTLSVVFICYFGGHAHKPRWLGISMIVLGIGSLTFASPQFFLGSYRPSGGSSSHYQYELCQDTRHYETDCLESDRIAYGLFVLGKVLMGLGAAPLYTVAQAYLDEIVHPKYISIYMGTYHAMGVLGPVLGYGLGSSLLSVYVDPWTDPSLTPSDPSWVGAWWISFVLLGALSIMAAVPFLMYPRYLSDSYSIWKERIKEMAKVYKEDPDLFTQRRTINAHILKDFYVQMKRLFLNTSFIFCSLALGGLYLISSGIVVFGPQFLESEFYQSPTAAGLIAGAIGVTTAVFGVLTGAFLIYIFKLKGRKMMFLCFIVSILSAPLALGLFVHCPSTVVVGVNTRGINGSYDIDGPTCVQDCECLSHSFEPVCGQDGLTYFSPCRAGCFNKTDYNNEKIYYNCQCVKDEISINSNDSYQYSINSNDSYQYSINSNDSYQYPASNGKCNVDCNLLIPFIIGAMFVLCSVFIMQIPIYYFTIRVVADDQRSLALGLQSAIWRLSGAIPGPIIFGIIFDSSCLKWEGTCGHHGNCWLYNNTHLSSATISFAIPVMVVVSFLFLLSFLTFPKTKKEIFNEEEDRSSSVKDGSDHYVQLNGAYETTDSEPDDDKEQLIRPEN